MPIYNNHKIELCTPKSAYSLGYLTLEEYKLSEAWVNENFKERSNKEIIYIDGVYKGMAIKTTPLHVIVDKFKL